MVEIYLDDTRYLSVSAFANYSYVGIQFRERKPGILNPRELHLSLLKDLTGKYIISVNGHDELTSKLTSGEDQVVNLGGSGCYSHPCIALEAEKLSDAKQSLCNRFMEFQKQYSIEYPEKNIDLGKIETGLEEVLLS